MPEQENNNPVDMIFETLMNDPEFEAVPGKTKEETAWAEAWRRFRQTKKNETALNMTNDISNDENEECEMTDEIAVKEMFQELEKQAAEIDDIVKQLEPTMPPRVGLVFKPRTHRWVNPDRERERRQKELRQRAGLDRDKGAKTKDEPERFVTVRRAPVSGEHAVSQRSRGLVRTTLPHKTPTMPSLPQTVGGKRKRGEEHIVPRRLPSDESPAVHFEKQQKRMNPFAMAMAQAKKKGYKDFSSGSPGREKFSEIAEAIKEKS